METQSRQQGFTLIEMMVVIAIVAILAVIGYPSYQNYIRLSRLEDARAALVENIQMMERHYVKSNSFCATAGSERECRTWPTLPAPATRFYDIAIADYNVDAKKKASNADNFVLQAVAKEGVYSESVRQTVPLTLYYSSLNGNFFRCKKDVEIGSSEGCEDY